MKVTTNIGSCKKDENIIDGYRITLNIDFFICLFNQLHKKAMHSRKNCYAPNFGASNEWFRA